VHGEWANYNWDKADFAGLVPVPPKHPSSPKPFVRTMPFPVVGTYGFVPRGRVRNSIGPRHCPNRIGVTLAGSRCIMG
jgi:hypothetical protein